MSGIHSSSSSKKAVFRNYQYIYIPKSKSKGGNYARNVGIKKASGTYIAFLDDDDEWMPDKIERQLSYFHNHPEFEIVHCGKIFEYDFNKVEMRNLNDLLEGDLSKKVWEQVPFTTSCLIVKKEVFDKVGMFDENLRFWQEYEFAMRACQLYKVGVIRDYLVLYRVITSDESRLTNKIDGWEKAVDYIKSKHEDMLAMLDESDRKKFQHRIYSDGVLRANNCENLKQRRKYLYKLFKLEPSVKSLLKVILNKDKFRNV